MTESSGSNTRGHLFIINGDLTALKCDAVLLPTDPVLSIGDHFRKLVDSEASQAFIDDLRRRQWGGQRIVKVEPSEPGPRVWLGNIGGDENTPVKHFTGAAEVYVKAAVADVRASGAAELLPIVALPVVGSGRGGGASRRGEILRDLVPLLMNLAVDQRCDIVLVTFGRSSFDAAQAARRVCIDGTPTEPPTVADPWRDFDARRRESADSLARHARTSGLVVFVGAGVSTSAGLPAWKGLLEGVATRLELTPKEVSELQELDVRDQASVLQRVGDNFRDVVESTLSSANYSLTHGLLVSLPVREFVTTNFDTLLETAAATPGNELTVLPGSPVRSSSRILVKLHGTLGTDLVLTRSEYRDVKTRHGALFGLLQAFMVTKHMLFVGYSMKDEDFNDVIHDVRELHKVSKVGDETTAQATVAEPPFGTVLADFENSQFAALWADLEVVPALPSRHSDAGPASEPTKEDWAQVTREHALLLDRVGMMSASAGFATDPTFAGVDLPGAEQLRVAVSKLRELYDEHGDKGVLWQDVRLLLETFSSGNR